MDHKVVLMPAAVDDLEAITKHIAKDNPEAAVRFGDSLIDAAAPLAKFPHMGRVIPDYESRFLRELMFESYRIPYRIIPEKDEIHILRFWHSARGTPSFEPFL